MSGRYAVVVCFDVERFVANDFDLVISSFTSSFDVDGDWFVAVDVDAELNTSIVECGRVLNLARGVGADDAKSSVEGRQLSDCTGSSRAAVLMGTLSAVGSFCGNSSKESGV